MKFRAFLFLSIIIYLNVACSLVPLPRGVAHNKAKPVGVTADASSVKKTTITPNSTKNQSTKQVSPRSSKVFSASIETIDTIDVSSSSDDQSNDKNDPSSTQEVQHGIRLLKEGNIEAATQKFEQVLSVQKNNRTAKSMLRQIKLKPKQYFSDKKFTSQYRVQPGDSFSTIASQFLGNSLEFHSLAKLNKRAHINDLSNGDIIVVPLLAPKDNAQNASNLSRPDNSKIKKSVAKKTVSNTSASNLLIAKNLYESGFKLLKKGDMYDAYQAFEKSLSLQPDNELAQKQLRKLKPEVTQSLHDEAMVLYKDQKIKAAIQKWDRVLMIDPAHELAKIYRGRATELKKRLDKLPKNL